VIVGLMADSHDNLLQVKKAVDFFNNRKVALVLHAGDYVAPFAIKELKKLLCPFIGVFGNNDGEKEGLKEMVGQTGEIHFPPFSLELSSKKVLLLHELQKLDSLKIHQYDLIVYGHTHKAEIRKETGTLLINPGECGGWLSGCSTVGWIDLEKMKAEIIALPGRVAS